MSQLVFRVVARQSVYSFSRKLLLAMNLKYLFLIKKDRFLRSANFISVKL